MQYTVLLELHGKLVWGASFTMSISTADVQQTRRLGRKLGIRKHVD